MYWRVRNKDYKKRNNAMNRADFKDIVEKDGKPGLLAYVEDQPVGWCSIAPREEFSERINHSRSFKPVDDKPVWSILCFYVHKDFRNRGIARQLLRGAIEFATSQGAKTLEAFPKDFAGRTSDAAIHTGTIDLFQEFNFVEVHRHPSDWRHGGSDYWHRTDRNPLLLFHLTRSRCTERRRGNEASRLMEMLL